MNDAGSPSPWHRNSDEVAQCTLNCIGDAILVTDISGQVTYLNPAAERMTGWPLEEASGRAVSTTVL
jgi:PAS domain S-box-containing protein